MKKVVGLFFFGMLLLSCNQNENKGNVEKVDANIQVKDGKVQSKLSSNSKTAKELEVEAKEREAAQAKEEKERLAKQTTMKITPNMHDFGEIPKETPVSAVFEIENTGDKPLIVSNAKASCGCTVPRKPEDPILPGEKGELEVTFTSTPNQAGSSINKTVTVTANIPGSTQVVSIRGKVDQ